MSEEAQARDFSEWDETLEKIATSGGTSVILGGTDVGKTTFCRLLVNQLVEKGKNVAIIDADVGQSEVGPPTCIGLALVEKRIATCPDCILRFLDIGLGLVSDWHWLRRGSQRSPICRFRLLLS